MNKLLRPLVPIFLPLILACAAGGFTGYVSAQVTADRTARNTVDIAALSQKMDKALEGLARIEGKLEARR